MLVFPAARAALWACVLCAAPAFATETPHTLTLQGAFHRTLAVHPDLQRRPLRRLAAEADAEIAAQRPALALGATLENAPGSGDLSGLSGAELTFTLGSVLEDGDKRVARVALAQSRLSAIDLEEEARRLDLLAEVARRYIAVAAAQRELEAARINVDQRERTVDAAARRVRAGASPASTRLGADAALAQAELARERSRQTLGSSRRRLALLWDEVDPVFDRVDGDRVVRVFPVKD